MKLMPNHMIRLGSRHRLAELVAVLMVVLLCLNRAASAQAPLLCNQTAKNTSFMARATTVQQTSELISSVINEPVHRRGCKTSSKSLKASYNRLRSLLLSEMSQWQGAELVSCNSACESRDTNQPFTSLANLAKKLEAQATRTIGTRSCRETAARRKKLKTQFAELAKALLDMSEGVEVCDTTTPPNTVPEFPVDDPKTEEPLPNPSNSPPVTNPANQKEVCNGLDDDMDGEIDDIEHTITEFTGSSAFALWFNHFNDNTHAVRFRFRSGATFVVNQDGSASATAIAYISNNGGGPGQLEEEWNLSLQFQFRGIGHSAAEPKLEIPALQTPNLTQLWKFYDLTSGTLTRGSTVATLTQSPATNEHPFQLGYFANGKNPEYGGSMWFDWVRTDGRFGIADINVKASLVAFEDEQCDGIDNNCDGDIDEGFDADGDSTPDCLDACPNDDQKVSPGQCGCGVSDSDLDGDGFAACLDACPSDPQKTTPLVCGCGIAETDSDGDGVPNCADSCPSNSAKVVPGLCGCNTSDTDSDNDGAPDCIDACPSDPTLTIPGPCGCVTLDTDNDGTFDCVDRCPSDPNKTQPGTCGCGIADNDSDGDNTPDCNDLCPNDNLKTSPQVCGCGFLELDSDFDGTPDCNDLCPASNIKTAPGVCGCDVADSDTDGDGVVFCNDNCPTVSNPSQVDSDNDGIGDPCDPFTPTGLATNMIMLIDDIADGEQSDISTTPGEYCQGGVTYYAVNTVDSSGNIRGCTPVCYPTPFSTFAACTARHGNVAWNTTSNINGSTTITTTNLGQHFTRFTPTNHYYYLPCHFSGQRDQIQLTSFSLTQNAMVNCANTSTGLLTGEFVRCTFNQSGALISCSGTCSAGRSVTLASIPAITITEFGLHKANSFGITGNNSGYGNLISSSGLDLVNLTTQLALANIDTECSSTSSDEVNTPELDLLLRYGGVTAIAASGSTTQTYYNLNETIAFTMGPMTASGRGAPLASLFTHNSDPADAPWMTTNKTQIMLAMDNKGSNPDSPYTFFKVATMPKSSVVGNVRTHHPLPSNPIPLMDPYMYCRSNGTCAISIRWGGGASTCASNNFSKPFTSSTTGVTSAFGAYRFVWLGQWDGTSVTGQLYEYGVDLTLPSPPSDVAYTAGWTYDVAATNWASCEGARNPSLVDNSNTTKFCFAANDAQYADSSSYIRDYRLDTDSKEYRAETYLPDSSALLTPGASTVSGEFRIVGTPASASTGATCPFTDDTTILTGQISPLAIPVPAMRQGMINSGVKTASDLDFLVNNPDKFQIIWQSNYSTLDPDVVNRASEDGASFNSSTWNWLGEDRDLNNALPAP